MSDGMLPAFEVRGGFGIFYDQPSERPEQDCLASGHSSSENDPMRRALSRSLAATLILCFVLAPSVHVAEFEPMRRNSAVYYTEHHRSPAAVRILTREVQHSPHDLKTLNLHALALTGARQTERGNKTFKEALDIDPRLYPARKNLAIHEFNRKRFGEAGTQFNRRSASPEQEQSAMETDRPWQLEFLSRWVWNSAVINPFALRAEQRPSRRTVHL